jgi:hypothetical protein
VNGVRERLAELPRRTVIIGAVVALLVVVAIIRFAGSGGGSSGSNGTVAQSLGAPTAVPVHVASVTPPGARVQTDAQTPAVITDALRNQEIVVIAFVMKGQADDDAVASAIAGLAAPQQSIAGVKYVVYDVSKGNHYGDLATILGVTSTPSVVIIGSDGKIANSWTGFVDGAVIQAALSQVITTGG